MKKKYEIRYSHGKCNYTVYNFNNYDSAYDYYKKIKRPKSLWDVTLIPELLLSSNKSGHGNEIINLTDLI